MGEGKINYTDPGFVVSLEKNYNKEFISLTNVKFIFNENWKEFSTHLSESLLNFNLKKREMTFEQTSTELNLLSDIENSITSKLYGTLEYSKFDINGLIYYKKFFGNFRFTKVKDSTFNFNTRSLIKQPIKVKFDFYNTKSSSKILKGNNDEFNSLTEEINTLINPNKKEE